MKTLIFSLALTAFGLAPAGAQPTAAAPAKPRLVLTQDPELETFRRGVFPQGVLLFPAHPFGVAEGPASARSRAGPDDRQATCAGTPAENLLRWSGGRLRSRGPIRFPK